MNYELKGRADSVNAEALEKELMDAYAANGTLELDATHLEYISSAGLRVLLKLCKEQGKLTITNVNSAVYEIMNITGFTELFDVKRPLRFVSVKGLTIIGRGGHGHVYKLSEDTIIKVYHDQASLEMIDKERSYAKNAFLQGIPSPIAFDVVNTEEGYGVVLEMVGAQTLSSFLMANPDKVDEYALKFAALLKKLNQTKADPSLYGSISEIYRNRIDNAKKSFTDEEYAIMIKVLESIREGDGMIHGDYHTNNVMVNGNGELMLIDMADISRGNPIFDIGGSYLTMVQSGVRDPNLVPKVIGIDYEKSVRIFQIMVRTYFETENSDRIEMIMKRLNAFSLFRSLTTLGMQSANGGKFKEAILANAREHFFPNADGIIQLFKMEL